MNYYNQSKSRRFLDSNSSSKYRRYRINKSEDFFDRENSLIKNTIRYNLQDDLKLAPSSNNPPIPANLRASHNLKSIKLNENEDLKNDFLKPNINNQFGKRRNSTNINNITTQKPMRLHRSNFRPNFRQIFDQEKVNDKNNM